MEPRMNTPPPDSAQGTDKKGVLYCGVYIFISLWSFIFSIYWECNEIFYPYMIL